jgi:hypothetical protein
MNMQKLLRQAQEMQEKMKRDLTETVVDASVGGGLVSVRMDGNKRLVSIAIEPEVADPEDLEMLQDLIIAAVNSANSKVDETLRDKLGSMASGMPNLF